jgi:hypothetical protein
MNRTGAEDERLQSILDQGGPILVIFALSAHFD